MAPLEFFLTLVIKSNLATSWTIKCRHTICSRIEITLPYSFFFFSLLLRYCCALLSTMMASEGYFQLVRSKHDVYHETKFYTSKSGPIKSRTNVKKKREIPIYYEKITSKKEIPIQYEKITSFQYFKQFHNRCSEQEDKQILHITFSHISKICT